MRPDEREVAGLTCSEVMVDLSRYLDHDLPPARATRIEAHVADCSLCATFGAGFARMIEQVRERMSTPEPVPSDIAARLHAALLDVE
jgi:anti-sigma factor RsiW